MRFSYLDTILDMQSRRIKADVGFPPNKHIPLRKKWSGTKPILSVLRYGVVVALLILSVRLGLTSSVLNSRYFGLGSDIIPLSGTGSMYPTFPKGTSLTPDELAKEIVSSPRMQRYPSGFSFLGMHIFTYDIAHGDIVSFTNERTKSITERDTGMQLGFVKRVIALPGEEFEIRDGIVYINEIPQKEPYVARARSTFGGESLHECKKYIVPEGKLIVLGDNRKGSSDSRHELGFIRIADITHVLSWTNQVNVYDQKWHNAENDLIEAAKIVLDVETYIRLLNEKRKAAGVSELTYQKKLEKSADLRGRVMLEYNDFSFEATKSGLTMKRYLREVGYSNIVTGEAPTQGYYEAAELLENQFAFPESSTFLLDPDYQEIGISEVQGEINGCPTQVIVQHLGGYKPPNYSQSDIQAWESVLTRLEEIKPGWQGIREHKEYYEEHKTDSDRIIEIIDERIRNITAVVKRMKANQWLSDAERQYTERDQGLSEEQLRLADKLNSQ